MGINTWCEVWFSRDVDLQQVLEVQNWLNYSGQGEILGLVCTRMGCELKSTQPQKVMEGLLEPILAGGMCWELVDFSCILILVVSISYLDYCRFWDQGPTGMGLLLMQGKELLS